ncbi:amino acid adenylation domain-containing protein [Streptomyces sp. NBC_01102]|uniref:amino acid adenylation domain-containing protein n=1 Tax=Streptomyces sp. NBC_01102 TaxID=2903749 RepID=UPI00386D3B0C|nr:amino acid adenylation domain-containing protein [Streptomyces sp. NBC_01102]
MQSVHGAFEKRVLEYPDSVAVESVDGRLTYRELDERADGLARRLAGLGVGPEAPVAICAEPSVSLVVAILGVLKAGAAFVPLDPGYPPARLAGLLADSGAAVALVQTELTGLLSGTAARLVPLDVEGPGAEEGPEGRLSADVPPDGVACVYYTSGSTGSPKGVLVTHRGLLNLASAAAQEFGLAPGDRFLQLASIGFSAALEEMFPSLLCGATLVLAGYRRALPDVRHFLGVLEERRITGFEITTAYWHQLMDELNATGDVLPARIRFVVVGGDRARAEHVLAWRRTGIPLINVYGPTEATATASYHHTGKERPDPDGLLPIGRAITGARMHLLDVRGHPVAPGAKGEIHVGGACLARGYLGDPAQTARAFVPDPFGAAGERLYRTGDLGRVLPDGTVEFLGRRDNQIKIRGVRIEPAEVEAALQRYPGIRQALVSASADEPEDRHLVAYLTAGETGPPDEGELRAHLSSVLPSQLVPSVYVVLDAMPLTAHGKVDRAGLPPVTAHRPRPATPYAEPRTGTEAALTGLWAEVLKRELIGARDDFFALGGNSLQAVRIVAKARRRFGVALHPNDLLAEPTVAAFAARIDGLLRETAPHGTDDEALWKHWREELRSFELQTVAQTGQGGAGPLSLSQRGLWMLSRFQPGIPLYNEAWQCRLHGPLDRAALGSALSRIAERHEVLRTRFAMAGPQPVQIVDKSAEPRMEFCDLAGVDPSRRLDAALALRDEAIMVPLDPSEAPLAKVWLFPLAEDEHLMVLTMHHIVWDGISKEVFLDELVAGYEAFRHGEDPVPQPLPLTYREYALWQRSHLTGTTLDRLLGYWRTQLADPPEPLPLPTDRPAPPVQDYAGARIVLPLAPALRDRVIEVARCENVTPFMLLFTALIAHLHHSTGQDDLCAGTPLANRTLPGTESLIGCFINSVALRVKIDDGMTRRQALARVRATCLDAIAHQELPFDKLVEELRPKRIPGRSPYFQVWFAMGDDTLLPRKSPGLSIDGFEDLSTGLSTGMAKLDLNWIVVDRGDHYALSLTYRTGLFDEDTARSMVNAFQERLGEILQDPGAPFRLPARPDGGQDDGLRVEERLLAQWREIFHNDDIVPDDDFFELGGYSMLAVEVITHVQEEFGVEISFADFFEVPTVAELARKITSPGS